MKTLTTLLISGLIIGNFVSTAQACMDNSMRVDSTEVMRTRSTPLVRVSRRTLENNVRKTWRNIKTTTKGF